MWSSIFRRLQSVRAVLEKWWDRYEFFWSGSSVERRREMEQIMRELRWMREFPADPFTRFLKTNAEKRLDKLRRWEGLPY